MQGLVFLLDITRQDLRIVCPGIVTTSGQGLTDDHPGVVMAEDTGVLLIALWIRGDLTILIDIL